MAKVNVFTSDPTGGSIYFAVGADGEGKSIRGALAVEIQDHLVEAPEGIELGDAYPVVVVVLEKIGF